MQATSGSVEHLQLPDLRLPGTKNLIIGPNLRSIHVFTISPFRLMESLFKSCSHDTRLESVILEGSPKTQYDDPSLNSTIESAALRLRSSKMVEFRV